MNADISKVFLSVLREFPLLDANHKDTLEKIREKNIPVLIFWGESDNILPFSLSDHFKECLPQAKLLKLPGDHGVFLSRPVEVFNNMIHFIYDENVT